MSTPLRATYRLQLHADFGFDAARALLPYLQRLGISHVYCSPIATARAGSRHGYDVVDPSQINPELGGRDGFIVFAQAARQLGIGLLLDQVPNHMAVYGAGNAWWQDVLEHGPASLYADWFDIDWQPPNAALAGKLLLPILGAAYGEVLDRGEIALRCDTAAGTLALHYHQHRFALDPRSYAPVLEAAQRRELHALAGHCLALPPRDVGDGGAAKDLGERADACRALQRRLAALLQSSDLAAALHDAVAAINAEPRHERLHALHEAQAWRLADWRMAADEINYRRFFDINELAALRIEDERVFDAVQSLGLDLAAQGWADGLRIDHSDGLRDPAGYFRRLQQGYARRVAENGKGEGEGESEAKPLYVVAEKIVAAHEEMPRDWAVHGSTGYRFSQLVNGLFVERRSAQRLQRIWRDFSGDAVSWADQVHRCKRLVAHGALAAQLTTLTHALQRVALADRRTRDWGFNTLRNALAEVAAAMPVYRTYIVEQPSAQDRRCIDWAVAQARRQAPMLPSKLFDFVRSCLLLQPADDAVAGAAGAAGAAGDAADAAAAVAHDRRRDFALGFQQFCAPLAAKGVEDTAFYRWHRLVSLNEVGGDPDSFGVSAAAFHGASKDRDKHWPHTLLATSTHDHKRSEGVRCRIDALSEEPAAWRLMLRRWKTQTRSWRRGEGEQATPSAADLMLLLQTLLGTWPAAGLNDEHHLAAYRDRIEAYMIKAAREAKQHTRWIDPDEAYEAALLGVVRGVLARIDGNPVLADLQARALRLAWFGALNGLSMTLLKLCSPGVPDFYQGSELIDLSLVDPDNRGAVDFGLRERWLAEQQDAAASAGVAEALRALATDSNALLDGRVKLWLIWRLLALRRERAALFSQGGYVPLRVFGARRRHAIAFARRDAGAVLVVMAARKYIGLGAEPGTLPLGDACWDHTELRLPRTLVDVRSGALRATDVLSARTIELPSGALPLATCFARLPVAALLIDTEGTR